MEPNYINKNNRIERNSVSMCSILEDRIQELGIPYIGVTKRSLGFKSDFESPETMVHYLFVISEAKPEKLTGAIGIRYNGIRDLGQKYPFDKKLGELGIEKEISYFLNWSSILHNPTDCNLVSVNENKREEVERFITEHNEMVRGDIRAHREMNSEGGY